MQKETNKNVSDFIPKIIVPRIDGSMISEIKKLTKEDDEYDFSVYSYDPDDEHINAVVEGWKAEKLVKPYIEDHGPIREARKYYIVADGRFVMQELKIPPPDSGKVWDVVNINLTDNFFCVIDENVTINDEGVETEMFFTQTESGILEINLNSSGDYIVEIYDDQDNLILYKFGSYDSQFQYTGTFANGVYTIIVKQEYEYSYL